MLHKVYKHLRKHNNLTQKQVAEALGFSTAYICELEKQRKKCTLESLMCYSKYFKIPASHLLWFSEILSGTDKGRNRSYIDVKIQEILENIK